MGQDLQPLAVLMSWGEERSRVLLTLTAGGEITIGRDGSNTVALPVDRMVSRHYCGLRAERGQITLRDLRCGAGTYLAQAISHDAGRARLVAVVAPEEEKAISRLGGTRPSLGRGACS